MKSRVWLPAAFVLVLGLTASVPEARAPLPATSCTFVTSGNVMTLQGDCWTDASIVIPDGVTMDLAGFVIMAVDPAGDTFKGPVVRNGGAWAGIRNGTITTQNLTNACKANDERLRGVMFQGASGFIDNMSIDNINKGASGCQEGNAIEVRNEPFDGTHPATVQVEVSANVLTNWQKTGIVANGDVDVWIHHNVVNGSATQANLAANSIQVGFGGKALVEHNHVAGNTWAGASDTVATSILLFQSAPGTIVRQNILMEGNSDVGIYAFADGVIIDNNKVFESGTDQNQFGYDIGVGNYGVDNEVTNNKAKGYSTAYDNVTTGKNKDIPAPSKQ
jgi:hypothetical protein